ncbi:hypothetical protein [Sediminibacter sp. Hel_I_10]|uniref:hypothetical protein n=1 Tax=Sediminibacter sp. Hel_I_10 TaxID=1392490 RepID=UPI00047D28A8|nr:hypothetical protein [Sediminibacter sp. Hel_I_10]
MKLFNIPLLAILLIAISSCASIKINPEDVVSVTKSVFTARGKIYYQIVTIKGDTIWSQDNYRKQPAKNDLAINDSED